MGGSRKNVSALEGVSSCFFAENAGLILHRAVGIENANTLSVREYTSRLPSSLRRLAARNLGDTHA